MLVSPAAPLAKGFVTDNQEFFGDLPTTLEIDANRVQFTVSSDLKNGANTCEIEITNLDESSRNKCTIKPARVSLYAGYSQDVGARLLFVGDLVRGTNEHKVPEWSTKLQLGDGIRSTRSARISKSYRAGTTVLTAVTDCAASMGMRLPSSITNDPALKKTFNGGQVAHGSSAAELKRLLAPYGFDWSVQKGELVVLRDSEVRGGLVWQITEETGLIGSPEAISPPKSDPGEPTRFKVTTLLFPDVTPGGQIDIVSDTLTGLCRVEKTEHKGDTHGNDWTTTMEVRKL